MTLPSWAIFGLCLFATAQVSLAKVVLKPGNPICSGGKISSTMQYKGESSWYFDGTSESEVVCNPTSVYDILLKDSFTITSVFFVRQLAFPYPSFPVYDDGLGKLRFEVTAWQDYFTFLPDMRFRCSTPVKSQPFFDYVVPAQTWYKTRLSCKTENTNRNCTYWLNGKAKCSGIILDFDLAKPSSLTPLYIGSGPTGEKELAIGEIHSVTFEDVYDDSSDIPDLSIVPTTSPTKTPSNAPSIAPSKILSPSNEPSAAPSRRETLFPTQEPTFSPNQSTSKIAREESISMPVWVPFVSGIFCFAGGVALSRYWRRSQDSEAAFDLSKGEKTGFPSFVPRTRAVSSQPVFVLQRNIPLFSRFRPVSTATTPSTDLHLQV